MTAGFNYSFAKVTDRYSVLTASSEADNAALEKEYGKFGKNKGTQFGIQYSYNFSNTLSIVTGFGYQTSAFTYQTQYSWADSTANQEFNREMHHLQKVSYFTLPIMGRWDMTEGQFKPYLQCGIFMDFRQQARKQITYDNVLDGEETENQTTTSGMIAITENFRKFNMGFTAGAGVKYYTKYVTLGAETNFRYGFSKIVNDENRYSDLNGFSLKYLDVLDQLKLGGLNIQFSATVPISNAVNSDIMRRKRYNRRK